jgi:hypothetical protein
LEKDIKKMINWRQIFSYRTEPELPNGFGRDVKAASSEYENAIYVGVCVYQEIGGNDYGGNTYAIWSEKIDPSWDEDIEDALKNARETFDEHKEEYLQQVPAALQLPRNEQHLTLAGMVNVDWLHTDKCEFIED